MAGRGAGAAAGRMRRVGVLQGLAADDQEWRGRLAAFRQALAELGRVEGRNITLEFRHADGRPERLPALAAELVQAQLDVIVTNAAQSIVALRAATSTIPIVMASVGDALGAGYVASLAHPEAMSRDLRFLLPNKVASVWSW